MKSAPKRIAIISDAWEPQINGVVTTLKKTAFFLRKKDYDVKFFTPEGYYSIPCPTYPEIRLAVFCRKKLTRDIELYNPNGIHIATEGPLGLAGRKYCITNKILFTTSFHTQFPEYLRMRIPVPINWTYSWLKLFHGKSQCVMVPSKSRKTELERRGFKNVAIWSRGVDTKIFNNDNPFPYQLPRPIHIYMGRVALEKNISSFLELKLEGSKIVIGDGPDLKHLSSIYTETHFLGVKRGRELASYLSGGDVFVFPSKTDTFGIVMLEAMACGLPIAAYPVEGPQDIVKQNYCGVLNDNLYDAISGALKISKDSCINYATNFSWDRCTQTFESNLRLNHPRYQYKREMTFPF